MKHRIKGLVAANLAIMVGFAGIGPASAETVLKFATGNPGQNTMNDYFVEWAAMVNKSLEEAGLDDPVRVEVITGTTVSAPGQALDKIERGIIDIGFDLQSYYPNKFTGTAIAGLPNVFEDSVAGSQALWDLYDSGEIAPEYDGLKVLGLFVFPNADIITVDAVTEDNPISKMKLTATSASRLDLVKALGATPVSVKIFEWYQSAQRGVIDGALQSTSAVGAFSLQEVMHHVIEYPFGGNAGGIFMNEESLAKLPEAAQKAILDNSGIVLSTHLGKMGAQQASTGRKLIESNDGDIRAATEAEAAVFEAAAKTIREGWIAEHEGSQDILARLEEFVAKREQ
jgi:TRAP-type C4-dicarboxylate transport system substrate-binding protein